MSAFICRSCRKALGSKYTPFGPREISRGLNTSQLRLQDSKTASSETPRLKIRHITEPKKIFQHAKAHGENYLDSVADIEKYLAEPTWSVSSLLSDKPAEERLISQEQFDHLLRLSGLPSGATDEPAQKFRRQVSEHLHFVDALKEVDTEGVEPLVVIRDETEQGIKDITIGLEDLQEALGKEEIKGRMKRPRRIREKTAKVSENVDELAEKKGVNPKELTLKMTEDIMQLKEEEQWDCLSHASETMNHAGGRYFVVRAGKSGKSAGRNRKAAQSDETGLADLDRDTS